MGIDSSGYIHAAYYGHGGNLGYLTNESGAWVATVIDPQTSVGEYASLAIDGTDAIHIAYRDGANGDLRYITNRTGSWVISSVESSANDVGYDAALTLDGFGNAHIVYTDDTSHSLKLADNTGGSWSTTVLAPKPTAGLRRRSASVVLDPQYKLHVVYHDSPSTLQHLTYCP